MYKKYLKHLLDFIVALLVILFIFPILLISTGLVKTTSPGPLFFLQERLGENGKIFKVYKFRTMTHQKREIVQVFGKSEGVTKVGYYLRRFKIDEMPQLINILKGEMSFIGPRPALKNQIESFNEDGRYRLKVKPGMTGLAQVNGNIYLTWEERWRYDRMYVENLTFLMDLRIILKTILVVILGEDKFINKNV